MKRNKKAKDDILKRHLPKASEKDIEAARGRVLSRLRQDLGETLKELGMNRDEDTPTTRVLRRHKEIDHLVLSAVQILGGRARLNTIDSVVNELADEFVDVHDISLSLERLARGGKLSIKALFGQVETEGGESADEEEMLRLRKALKQKP
jgi:hypothetical protein